MPDPEPGPLPAPRRRWSTGRIAGLALGCGLLAGALGVYVIGTGSGNEGADGAVACAADDELTAAIDAAARGEVAAMAVLDEPFRVSNLAFQDEAGTPMTIAALAGRSLLVNLWATWCAPCRAEMPALDALEREAGAEDFAVIPISVDMGSAEKPKAFYEEIGLSDLPFYQDGTMGIFNELKGEGIAFGLPATILVDEGGCARAAMNGPAEWASPDALALIEALRGAPAPGA